MGKRRDADASPIRLAVRLAAGESKIDAYDGAYPDLADLQGFRPSAADEPVPMTPGEFSSYYTAEIAKWKKAAQERNLSSGN